MFKQATLFINFGSRASFKTETTTLDAVSSSDGERTRFSVQLSATNMISGFIYPNQRKLDDPSKYEKQPDFFGKANINGKEIKPIGFIMKKGKVKTGIRVHLKMPA